MPAYIIVSIDIKDPVRYEDYKEMVPPTLARYGGRFLVRGGRVHVREGTWSRGRFVMLEFPTLEQAQAWYDSPEYAPARALRHSISTADLFIAEGIEASNRQ